ncbi:unnamed protein product [Adineta steineri]|uniref:RRM domain-containing protein n=1 Tax=Adineta steineri TaxID=433720 RepID=A0A814RUB3_9BILA|nr:unnamed protein product [Adineta steineri]CAF3604350.1 unnamed protein product [Adineta steineri]
MGRHRSRSDSRSRSRSMSSSSSGRGVQSSNWDGEAGYRVHISDLAAGISRKEIERVFTKYGIINEVWVATNPPCFAFVNFKHRSDADKAIREVDGKIIGSTRVGVSWARTRTFGGRNRGGRGYPYSSYRSSGSRRRSRSRSRSNSRYRRRRSRSRSNSRDRYRRRSVSPRERKRSRHSSGRRESKSVSRSRSRSRSSPRHKSPANTNGRSRSRGSSVGDRHNNGVADSSSATGVDANNAYNRSPIAAGGD